VGIKGGEEKESKRKTDDRGVSFIHRYLTVSR
jgi:hypothetical protein